MWENPTKTPNRLKQAEQFLGGCRNPKAPFQKVTLGFQMFRFDSFCDLENQANTTKLKKEGKLWRFKQN